MNPARKNAASTDTGNAPHPDAGANGDLHSGERSPREWDFHTNRLREVLQHDDFEPDDMRFGDETASELPKADDDFPTGDESAETETTKSSRFARYSLKAREKMGTSSKTRASF